MAQDAQPLTGQAKDQAKHAVASMHALLTGEGHVYNMAAEAEKTAQGTSNLDAGQLETYNRIVKLADTAPIPGTLGWKDHPEQRPIYADLKKELKALKDEGSVPVLGKLLYHAAHAPGDREGLMADIYAFSPEAKNMKFIGQKEKTPVSLRQIMEEGINVGKSTANVPSEKGWVWDKAQTDAKHIMDQEKQQQQPARQK